MRSVLNPNSPLSKTSTIPPSARNYLFTHRTRNNIAVLTGPHELLHKQKKAMKQEIPMADI